MLKLEKCQVLVPPMLSSVLACRVLRRVQVPLSAPELPKASVRERFSVLPEQ
ncbi:MULTISPECIES: hypothetical protein [unclassified Duganella]|uniref:hypothetical protein n=1 Tax=unclassified Duganella TaxID=2636909 RepID=UPI0013144A30|nr:MULTISPECIES: hypothetical protein [unclassified Duganella]